MGIDASIPLSVKPVQIDNPLDVQGKIMSLRHLALQGEQQQMALNAAQRQEAEQRTLADVYRASVNPDGTPNHSAIVQGMADKGLGHLIPGYRKTMLDADKDQAEIGYKKSQTEAQQFKLQKDRLDAISGSLNALLSRPQVTHDDIIGSVTNLVQNRIMSPEMGAQTVRNLPSNPAALRQFLTEKGLEAMEASKRMDMLAPKFHQVDQGGQVVMGTTNGLTGEFTPNSTITKTVTPDARLSSDTSIRNTDANNRTSMRNTDVTTSNAALSVEPTADGVRVINKRNAQSVPVMDAGTGKPVLPKDSLQVKQEMLRGRLLASVQEARDLIPKATNSGAGALIDRAGNWAGISSDSNDAATQLETLAGWMTSNVPRMEGPQSDRDTKLYREMAAQVGDRTIPASARLKALDTLETLQSKYSHLNGNTSPKVPNSRPPLSAFERK